MELTNKTPFEIAEILAEVKNEGNERVNINKGQSVSLSYSKGCFVLHWKSEEIGKYDWVGLYKSIYSSDDEYISKAWQWASKDKQYTTLEKIGIGYQARYLVYDYSKNKYVSIARTTPFPNVYASKSASFELSINPKEMAKKLSKGSEEQLNVIQTSNAVYSLLVSSCWGCFVMSWDANNLESWDWVGLYRNPYSSDDDYIAGAWQWAGKGKTFQTSVPVDPGYQLRYLRYIDGKYVSIAHTEEFPSAFINGPRMANKSETSDLITDFPEIKDKPIWVTDEATGKYNCIAWSLGYNDRWINPSVTIKDFTEFYESKGYSLVYPWEKHEIDGWVYKDTPKHGSKSYTGISMGSADMWESKLGRSLRIMHGRYNLEGDLYGKVILNFKKDHMNGKNLDMNVEQYFCDKVYFTENNITEIKVRSDAVNEELRQKFEADFGAWAEICSKTPLSFSSNTKDYAQTKEFEKLTKLGIDILPLVAEKLIDEKNFFALVLYDKLQTDSKKIISYSDQNEENRLLEGEQSRAIRTLKAWLE